MRRSLILVFLVAGTWVTTAASSATEPTARASTTATFSREQVQNIIRDVRRIVTPQGVEVLEPVEIGGIRQWISVRGKDRRNPILLFVHGGPASPEMPLSWTFQSGWED